jgi:TolA-binding protein
LEEQVEANDRIEERMIAIQTKERIKFEEEKMKLQKIIVSQKETIEELREELGSMEEKLEEYEDNFERVEEQEELIESQKEIIEKLNKKLEKKKYNKQYQDEHKEKVAKKKKEKAPKKKAYLQKAELLVCPCLANQKKTTFRRDGKSGHLKSKVHQEWYLANPDWEEPEIWKGENSTLHTKTEEEINELYDIEKSKTPIRSSVSSP